MTTEYKIIKLVSGEELIGRTVATEEGKTALTKVFQLLIMPQNDGTQQIALLPYHIHSSLHEKFTVKNEFIIFSYQPSQQLIDAYSRFVSPIIQPQNSGLIGV